MKSWARRALSASHAGAVPLERRVGDTFKKEIKVNKMICRKCGKTALEIGGYLARVNEKGVAGIWECRPVCGADLPQDTKLMLARTGEDESPNDKLRGRPIEKG